MQALRKKWRRTSKVWQYFDEVRENGEVCPNAKVVAIRN
jgi:pentatricopeptide repeat protein